MTRVNDGEEPARRAVQTNQPRVLLRSSTTSNDARQNQLQQNRGQLQLRLDRVRQRDFADQLAARLPDGNLQGLLRCLHRVRKVLEVRRDCRSQADRRHQMDQVMLDGDYPIGLNDQLVREQL